MRSFNLFSSGYWLRTFTGLTALFFLAMPMRAQVSCQLLQSPGGGAGATGE